MAGYYDAILALIPGVMIGITAVLIMLGLSLTQAVPIASLGSFVLIGHAMFVRSPVNSIEQTPVQAPRTPEVAAD